MSKSCLRPIDQLGAVVRTHIGQLRKVTPDICCTAVLDLGIVKNLDDLLQCGNLAVVETALCKSRQHRAGCQTLLIRRVLLRVDGGESHCQALETIPTLRAFGSAAAAPARATTKAANWYVCVLDI